MAYTELQVTTHFSFLRGASSPQELFATAALLGHSQDHRALLVPGVDELEEQVAAAWDDGKVADLVHDQ